MIFEDYFDDGDFESIQEAFMGKSKKLLELEKMVGENRKKYYRSFKIAAYYTDKDFIKIGDKIADIFGFKVCDFNIINDPAPNALTIPAGLSVAANQGKVKEYATNKEDVIKFKKNSLSCFVRVTSGMWSNPVFTDGEVVAVIVHEIGHNFQHEINSCLRNYATGMYFLKLYQVIVLATSGVGIPAAIYNYVASDSDLRAQVNIFAKNTSGIGDSVVFFSALAGFIRMIVGEIIELAGRLTLGIPAGLFSITDIIVGGVYNPVGVIVSILVSNFEKSQENVADTFASDHGYGPELISALSKINLDPEASGTAIGRICKKVPVFDSVCTAFSLPLMLISQLFASHPVTPKRAVNMVIDLEKQMDKSDISPKMKKEMQVQINEIKEVVEAYGKVEKKTEGTALRKTLYRMQVNYDRDPKGWVQQIYSKKDLMELAMEDFPEIDIDGEYY